MWGRKNQVPDFSADIDVPPDQSRPQTLTDDHAYRRLIDGIREVGIVMLDRSGNVAGWNRGASAITGYSPADIVGQPIARIYPAEAVAAQWPEQELTFARRDGHFEDDGWRVRKDGSRFWANVLVTPLYDDDQQFIGFSQIFRDLTQRREQETLLRESEERFRLLVDGVKDYAIYMLDPVGNIVSWNAGAERIKGYRADEVIGRHFSTFYPPAAIAAGWPRHELAVARERGRFEDEGWRVRKDGTMFWADVVITAIFDRSNVLRGFAKITRDLTEKRRLQQLEESERRMTEFLALLAHELRNPLAPISNAVRLMTAESSREKIQWCRGMIERQSSHLARLVDDLLDVSRVTSGKIVLQNDTVDMREVVERAVEAARPMSDERRHTLTVDLPDEPVCVTGDSVRLIQSVVNLLNNAVKYTPSGGRIACRLYREETSAVLTVKDNGIGIASEALPRIFELFVQGDQSLERTHGGLGVGLSLVDKLVKLHGGFVYAKSDGPGRGSEFAISLPLAGAVEAQARKTAPAPEPAAAGGRRVLIVDDNVDAAQSLALILEDWRHTVEYCYDSTKALDVAREFRPDVVLLDIGMPNLNGFDLARRFRDTPELRDAHLVAVTGYGTPMHLDAGKDAGFEHHLVKPVDLAKLEEILASCESRGDA
ncbi:MAG: PAS domain S-box protein [Gemmatimonas sp.]